MPNLETKILIRLADLLFLIANIILPSIVCLSNVSIQMEREKMLNMFMNYEK